MSKTLSKEVIVKKTIQISSYDNRRCSQWCEHCVKCDGLYWCFLNNRKEQIEGFDGFHDVDDKGFDPADTYGFKRTDSCLKQFPLETDQKESQ